MRTRPPSSIASGSGTRGPPETPFWLPDFEDTVRGAREIAEARVLDVRSLAPDQNAQECFFHPVRMRAELDGAGASGFGPPRTSGESMRRPGRATTHSCDATAGRTTSCAGDRCSERRSGLRGEPSRCSGTAGSMADPSDPSKHPSPRTAAQWVGTPPRASPSRSTTATNGPSEIRPTAWRPRRRSSRPTTRRRPG